MKARFRITGDREDFQVERDVQPLSKIEFSIVEFFFSFDTRIKRWSPK
jgi:hypothetical protein